MKHLKKYYYSLPFSMILCVGLFFHIPSVMGQEKNDSVARELKEVTVIGENKKVTAQGAKYFPSGKVKRASADAIDLLRRMSINQILINPVTKEVTTLGHENVAIFINGLPAQQHDIEGLRTQDVKMVEYLDFPTDPIYRGEQHVVSITLRQYEYGGYTKIYEDIEAINHFQNNASVFSKFVYKKMNFDAYIGSTARSSKHSGTSRKSEFSLADGNVTRNEEFQSGIQQQYNIPVSLRAVYNKQGMQIANTLGFTFSEMHKNRSTGSLSFTPSSISMGNNYAISAPSRGKSLSWSGGYYFIFPKGWSIYLIPTAAYSHNDSFSTYTNNGQDSSPIVSNAEEDAYNLSLQVNTYKTFNPSHSLNFNVKGVLYDSSTDYSGTNPMHVDNSNKQLTAGANYLFNHANRLFINLYAGAGASRSEVNGVRENQFTPFSNLSVTYMPTGKSRFQISADYGKGTVSAYWRSSYTRQINELLFFSGNPDLKGYDNLNMNASYSWYPCNLFSMQAYVRYMGWYDRVVHQYMPFKDGHYLLNTMVNNGDFNRVSTGMNLTGQFLSGSLVIQAMPSFSRSVSSGIYTMSKNYFSWSVNAQYYFGHWNLSAYCSSKDYTMGPITCDRQRTPAFYFLKLGWANQDWNLSLEARNMFRTGYNGQIGDFSSPYYSESFVYRNPSYRAGVKFTATYTFGYGKKLNRGDEIGAQGGVESAVAK